MVEIGFEEELLLHNDTFIKSESDSMMGSSSYEQTGILSDSYFDRKRIYEASLTSGSYVDPPSDLEQSKNKPLQFEAVPDPKLESNIKK